MICFLGLEESKTREREIFALQNLFSEAQASQIFEKTISQIQNIQAIFNTGIERNQLDQTIVGWFAPKKRHGRQCMGHIYIGENYRHQGFGLNALLAFKKKNPGLLWYADQDHPASQYLAKRAGLTLIGEEETEIGRWKVFEDLQEGMKTKICLILSKS